MSVFSDALIKLVSINSELCINQEMKSTPSPAVLMKISFDLRDSNLLAFHGFPIACETWIGPFSQAKSDTEIPSREVILL